MPVTIATAVVPEIQVFLKLLEKYLSYEFGKFGGCYSMDEEDYAAICYINDSIKIIIKKIEFEDYFLKGVYVKIYAEMIDTVLRRVIRNFIYHIERLK